MHRSDILPPQPLTPGCLVPDRQDHKYFDSADWALAKENKAKGDAAKLEEQLPPKLEPTPAPLRRVSQLDHCNH